MNIFVWIWSFIKSVLHVAASPATSMKISASSSGVFMLGRASGMSGMSGRGGSVLVRIGGGVGTGMGGCGRLNLGVSNGKRGNPRIRRLRRHTQGSRLLLFTVAALLKVRGSPRQVTLVELLTLVRASKLHSQEDMVGLMWWV